MQEINLKSDEYFDIEKFITPDISIYNIKGGRGVGKTFSVMKYIVENNLIPFVYLRLKSTELKQSIGVIEEQISAVQMLDKLGIEYDNPNSVAYVRGKPEGGTVSIRYKFDKEIMYKRIAYLTSIELAGTTKGFTKSIDDLPKSVIFDEYSSNGILRDDLYKSTTDILESLFRRREYLLFLLSNNNSRVEYFTDFYKEDKILSFQVNKELLRDFSNKRIENYLNGKIYQIDPSKYKLKGYYYLTEYDFISLWMSKKGVLFCQVENSNVKPKAKKDLSIFDLDIEFVDDITKTMYYEAFDKQFEL